MEKKLFSDMLNIVTVYIPIEQMIFNQVIAALVAFMIAWVYKKTYTGVIYSKNFSVTLILISVVTSLVMMVIGSSMALSLGMVGALSIIRFRSAIKDSRDVGYLFWGMSGGLASGTGNHIIAIAGTVITALVMFFLYKYLGEKAPYLLIVKGENISEPSLEEIFSSHSPRYQLKMKNRDNSGYELIYEILIQEKEETSFINQVNGVEGVNSIKLLSHKGEIIG